MEPQKNTTLSRVIILLVLLVVLALLSWITDGFGKNKETPVVPETPIVENVNIEGTTFRLSSFNGTEIPVGSNYTLSFETGKISAKFCNGMGGNYLVTDGIIKAQLIGTLMYCGEPANLMTMETTFGSILQSGAEFNLKGSQLTLVGKQGETLVYDVFMD